MLYQDVSQEFKSCGILLNSYIENIYRLIQGVNCVNWVSVPFSILLFPWFILYGLGLDWTGYMHYSIILYYYNYMDMDYTVHWWVVAGTGQEGDKWNRINSDSDKNCYFISLSWIIPFPARLKLKPTFSSRNFRYYYLLWVIGTVIHYTYTYFHPILR